MKKFMKYTLMVLIPVFVIALITHAGLRDRSSLVNLLPDGVVAGNSVEMPEITTPAGNPNAGYGWLYAKDAAGTTKLYFENDAGGVTDLITAAGSASDFALTDDADAGDLDIKSLATIEFYDIGLILDGHTDGVLKLSSDGTLELASADWDISTTGTITNASMSADQITAGTLGIGANPLTIGNSYMQIGTDPADAGDIRMVNAGTIVFEASPAGVDVTALTIDAAEAVLIGSAGASGVTITPNTTISGNLDVVGTTTLAGTFYLSDVAPAAGNLTLNGHLAGTVLIGNSSTGAITITGGGVNIGDAATDELEITGIIINDVTLDDGTTDSPKLIFKDSDNEQAEIYQDQASDDLEVECHDAADSLAVIVGNLSAGAPAAGVIGWNGGDLFVADDAEIDGTLVVDTDLDVNGTANISGATTQGGVLTLGANGLTLDGATNDVFEWNESTEDLLWTFGGAIMELSSTTGILELSLFDDVADVILSHSANGDADDFYIKQTGAHDASMFIQSAGTGADAVTIDATAGGIVLDVDANDILLDTAATFDIVATATGGAVLITATEAAANQIMIGADGAHAGVGMLIDTTNAGISIDANGANGNLDVDGAVSLDLISAGAIKLDGGGTVQIDSSDWDITTTGAATNMASIGFDSSTALHHTTVTIPGASIKTLNAAPYELIATPGANAFIELVSAVMYLDYSTAVIVVGGASDLVIEYGTSNDDITGSIETTGWLDQAVDQGVTYYPTSPQASNPMSDIVNNNVELYNTGAELAGDAGDDCTIVVKLAYRVHPWS